MSTVSTRISTLNSSPFAWGTDDGPQLAAAADAGFTSLTPTTVLLPCANMMVGTLQVFGPVRIIRGPYPVGFKGCGAGSAPTVLVPLPNMPIAGNTVGTVIKLTYQGGQTQQTQGFGDAVENILINGLGWDIPVAGTYTGTAYSVVSMVGADYCKDVMVDGYMWNAPVGKIIYGFENLGGRANNCGSYVGGNYSCHLSGAFGFAGSQAGGYCGGSEYTSLTVDGISSGVHHLNAATSQIGIGTQIAGGATATSAALNIPSGATIDYTDNSSYIIGTAFFSGGTTTLNSTSFNNGGGGAAPAWINVNNSAASVSIRDVRFITAFPAFPWLSISAGRVADRNCGNTTTDSTSGILTTGGTVLAQCSVGSDTQLAKATAQTAKTVYTVGPLTTLYRVHISVECTTTSAAATVTPAVLYTDTSNTAQTVTGSAATCTALGASSNTSQDVTFRAKNATAIQYQTTIANTPTYDVSVLVEKLSDN